MCLAQGPQRSEAGEARIRGPSVSSQALYHRATEPLRSQYVCPLHDNAPEHASVFVKRFLKSEKVTVLPHPPYFPDLALCNLYLDIPPDKPLAQPPAIPKSAYYDAFRKWIHRLKLCISNQGDKNTLNGC